MLTPPNEHILQKINGLQEPNPCILAFFILFGRRGRDTLGRAQGTIWGTGNEPGLDVYKASKHSNLHHTALATLCISPKDTQV